MKVAVFLSSLEPLHGGGFTFQDEIFHSLMRLEGRHSFVIFGNLGEDETENFRSENLGFISLQDSLSSTTKSKWDRIRGKAVAKLARSRNRPQPTYDEWLKQTLKDQEIEFVWFVGQYPFVETDIPYIFTVFDLQHRRQPWFPEVSSGGEWESREMHFERALRRASAVIVGTEAGKEEVVGFYRINAERVKLIPHPTPSFALTASKDGLKGVLSKYGIPEGYLFFPAQFWSHKNHVTLLLAVKLLQEKHGLQFHVVFVGSDQGNLQYVHEVTEELGLSSQVHFLGFVPQEDIVGLYCNAFALIYPTFFGPENLPPLEAFALGCPVIASNVAGAQEQLGEAALLVDPRMEEEIAMAIKQIYEDPALRQSLLERGLKRARQWTGEDYVRSVLAIFDDFEPVRRCWGKHYPS